MKTIKITLEDKGQDFLELHVNAETSKVVDAKPFQKEAWVGAYIPIHDTIMFKVGEPCPIHHPPHIWFGFLNYKIENITYDEH